MSLAHLYAGGASWHRGELADTLFEGLNKTAHNYTAVSVE